MCFDKTSWLNQEGLCSPNARGKTRGEVKMKLRECIRASTLGLFWLALSAAPIHAEWQVFREGDGLAYGVVSAILEDSSENLWFGTGGGGVSRYDGVNWTTFTKADGLAGDGATAIAEDSSGDIWFAGGGIARYDGTKWTTYLEEDGLSLRRVSKICVDGAGNLWFGSYGDGAFRFDGEQWIHYTEADGLAGNIVNAIIQDSSGNMWFCTNGSGVSLFDGESWTTYTTSDGLANDYVECVLEDSSGDLWFGTFRGVSRYDGYSWTTYTGADGLMDNWVRRITEDRWGNLWFGSLGGLSRFDGRGWRTYREVINSEVWAITEDSTGNMWFGTDLGAWRFDGEMWTNYIPTDGWENAVRAIVEDSVGNLWFGGNGAIKYDGASWKTYTEDDGLAGSFVSAILEDMSGSLWFGTLYSGVSRFDGENWTTYTIADGLADDHVYSICEDGAGNLWFGTAGGVSLFDGAEWTTFTEADGLVDDLVWTIMVDKSGRLWFGTKFGVSSYDGLNWKTHTESRALAEVGCSAIYEDRSGDIWFGTDLGLTRYDGSTWMTYSEFRTSVWFIHEDLFGNLWVGTAANGVARYDGESWKWYTEVDGLSSTYVKAVYQDSSGVYWLGTFIGLLAYETDRVSPQTVIWPKPTRVSANTVQDIGFTAAFGEGGLIEFSYSFDESPWSDWSMARSWTSSVLDDGEHVFRVRARDVEGNIDPTPAKIRFEIDATPPSPILFYPAFGQAIKDSIDIVGTASDLRFKQYSLEIRPIGSENWTTLGEAPQQVTNGKVGGWNTMSYPDGDYELRLSVTDTLGLTGDYPVRVTVDNEAPWAYETTPAVISPAAGGDVYTTGGMAHLYFPPGAFEREAEVRIEEPVASEVPDTLADGATKVMVGYELSWNGAPLVKAAALELSLEGQEAGSWLDNLAVYVYGKDSTWRRIGGTVNLESKRVSLSLSEEGRYSVFAGGQGAGSGAALFDLSVTPRVFSPTGGFASSRAAIGFTLGRPGRVTVKVYNRAGRLVRKIASGERLNAGANLVHWDGRNREGDVVDDGLYLVTVEAQGKKQVKAIAVVR